MTTLKVYGVPQSRAARTLWMVEECGVPYEHVATSFAKDAKSDAYKAINPNQRIPAIDDDGVIVWESMAINLYLADLYGGPLWPDDMRERALVYQWSFWVQAEMDRRDWQKAWRTRDVQQSEIVHKERLATLGILDAALSGRDYLIGDAFTFADLNVAATICQPNEGERIDGNLDPAEHDLPALTAWLKRCVTRPSWVKLRDFP